MKLVRLTEMCLNETYNKDSIDKYLSDRFPIQNDLKQDDLSPLLFNCALEYPLSKVQENQVELKLNGTHQLLVYADFVNLLGYNRDTIKENRDTLIRASNEVCLQIKAEKTKNTLLSRHQSAGQNRDLKIAKRFFENMA
jgi:hypothetical protein